MAVTTIANMQIVPDKFSQYTLNRTTNLSMLVKAGIAVADPVVASLIGSMPEGGRFIEMPHWNALSGEDDVFGEEDVSISDISTGSERATLLMRQKAWGSTDLAHVLGGADPMAAIGNLVSDWWMDREQAIYLSVLKGVLDPASGALKDHVNDISTGSGEAACISAEATLETKQAMGDAYKTLGMVFMHSATYTYLQKKGLIVRQPIFDPSQSPIELETYLGYKIAIDDGMPVNAGVYDTYFLGSGAFVRQDGAPTGFVGTETDRDRIGAKNYLINRRAMIVHPKGISWVSDGIYTNPAHKYPANADLAKPANWKLVTDHKKVPMVCLRHKLG